MLAIVLLAYLVPSAGAAPAENLAGSSSGWLQAANATGAVDGVCATISRPATPLVLTDFGFSIPDDAQIRGIVVRAFVARNNSSPMTLAVRKADGGLGRTQNLNRRAGATSCASAAAVTVGGQTDNWALRLTAADINSAGFGVVINSDAAAGTRYVDSVGVTVHFRPRAASTLTLTAASSTQVDLTWTDNSSTEDDYRVERCTGARCTGFALVEEVAPDTESYADTSVTEGSTYVYRVRAHDADADVFSADSNLLTVPVPPAAPTDLAADAPGTRRVDLTWTDNSAAESGYLIERCLGSGCTNFRLLTTTVRNRTAYVDTRVGADTTYAYRVRAYNRTSGRYSEFSDVVEVTTLP